MSECHHPKTKAERVLTIEMGSAMSARLRQLNDRGYGRIAVQRTSPVCRRERGWDSLRFGVGDD